MAKRKLEVTITGDAASLSRAFGRANKDADQFATKLEARQKRLGQASRVAGTAVAAGVGGGLAYAVKAAMGFEKQLSSLGAVANANSKEMDALRKSALKAGADTAYSAKEAALAQTELAKGGLSAATILKGGLSGALSLAAAGEMELGEAAATTANALNLFGMRGQDAGKVADALATAANATTADVSDFSMALKAGGSVAKMAGYSFSDTVVGLEAMAAAGIKNSDAGTSMKASLLALAGPNDKQAGLAKSLGLEFKNASGGMKNASEMSAMLRDKLGGMGEAQRIATLKTLAGSDGVRYLSSLYAAGPAKLDGYEKALGRQGTAAEVARKKQDNLAGDLEKLKGSAETLGITVGTALIPKLSAGAQAADRFISGMVAGKGAGGQFAAGMMQVGGVVQGAAQKVQAFVSTTGGLVTVGAVVGGLTGRLVGLGAAMAVERVVEFAGAVKGAGGAMAYFSAAVKANPLGILLTVVGAVAGAIGIMKLRTDSAKTSAASLNDALRNQADALRAVRDIDIDVAQRKASARSAVVGLERAEANLAKLRRSGKASALQIREAEADVAQAKVAAKRATRELGDAEEDSRRKREDGAKATATATAKTRSYNGQIDKSVSAKQREIKGIETSIGSMRQYASSSATVRRAIEKQRDRQRELRDEIAKLRSKKVDVKVNIGFNVKGAFDAAIDSIGKAAQGAGGTGGGLPLTQADIDGLAKRKGKALGKKAAKKFALPGLGGAADSIGKLGGKGASSVDAFRGAASKMGLQVTSGYRAGDDGWHGQNRARDFSNGSSPTPQMMAFAKYMAKKYGSKLLELIYTPLGFSIKNGKKVAPFAKADHFDHVHVAMANGGLVRVGETGPENVWLPDKTRVQPSHQSMARKASGGAGGTSERELKAIGDRAAKVFGDAIRAGVDKQKGRISDAISKAFAFPLDAQIRELEAQKERLQASFDAWDQKRQRQELVAAVGSARKTVAAEKKAAAEAAKQEKAATRSGGGGRGPSAGNSNAGRAWDFFKAHGFTDGQAAGWLGNIQQESGFNPGAVQKGGPGRGLIQWGDGRFTALQQFAAGKGKAWTDFQTQLEFIMRELAGPEASAGKAIRGAKGTRAASIAIGSKYERYGDKGARDQYADEWYKRYKGKGGGGSRGGGRSTPSTSSADAKELAAIEKRIEANTRKMEDLRKKARNLPDAASGKKGAGQRDENEKTRKAIQDEIALLQRRNRELRGHKKTTKAGADAIDQTADAVKALKEFDAAATRAKKLSAIDVKIKGLEQVRAFRQALGDVREQVAGKLTEAVDKFRENWENTTGKAIDKANAGILKSFDATTAGVLKGIDKANAVALEAFDAQTEAIVNQTDAARELARIRAGGEVTDQAEEDRAQAEALRDALNMGGFQGLGTYSPESEFGKAKLAAIREAQLAIERTARQRREEELTRQIEGETEAIRKQRAEERERMEEAQGNARAVREEAFAEQRQAMEDGFAVSRAAQADAEANAFAARENAKIAALNASLDRQRLSYAEYVTRVNALLGSLGVGPISGDPSAEAAIGAGTPGVSVARPGGGTIGVGPGTTMTFAPVGSPAKKPKRKGRASGGRVIPGVSYTVGEVGRERFTPDSAGRVRSASHPSSKEGGGGGNVNMYGPVHIGSQRAAEVMANKLGHRLVHGGV